MGDDVISLPPAEIRVDLMSTSSVFRDIEVVSSLTSILHNLESVKARYV